MHWIDWTIVLVTLTLITLVANITKKYTRSVADFLAANRCAGRYLISVSAGMACLGAISLIAGFELHYKMGFSGIWWNFLMIFVATIAFLSGWILYRFRQTRALTLAQFLEIRYSRRFRVFAGLIAWLSGIINFGIFPSVGARFFIYFCGFPDTMMVYVLIMLVLLMFALYFTFVGGQIAVIVTDFVQGIFTNVVFVIIMIAVFLIFSWPQITQSLQSAPAGASMLHPLRNADAKDFNIWFFLILAFNYFYANLVWQGSQAYNASALNAHEARMGRILGTWRVMPLYLFMAILPVCAYTFLHHPDFADLARQTHQTISAIGNPYIEAQMTTPIAMRYFLPTGIMGLMAAIMLCAFIANHDTYLHSWGSIFIQDVVMPFRKKPFTTKQHLFLLKLSIMGVAVFIFIFSLIFRQTEYIYMFFAITGAIFTGGAGSVVIGGLYWKKGTTSAAWSAMITGSILSVASVFLKQIHNSFSFENAVLSYIVSLNGAVLSFFASLIAIVVYIIVSLVDTKYVFNMDKMLHRGKYAIETPEGTQTEKNVGKWISMIGINNEFTPKDKFLYIATFSWTVLWILIFVIGTIYNLLFNVEDRTWMIFWKYYTYLTIAQAVLINIWFIWGGACDLKKMFHLLDTIKRNELDDGMVIHDTIGEPDKSKTKKEQLHDSVF